MNKELRVKEKIETPGSSKVLIIFGWIIIICGFIAGFSYYSTVGVMAIMLLYWAVGGLSGLLLIGMGRIIQLLTIIANKEYTLVENVEDTSNEATEETNNSDIS